MGSLKNYSENLSCKSLFSKPMKIRLNPKDEPPIFKIERVMWVFVKQSEAKISIEQEFQISKSWSNLFIGWFKAIKETS